jgi:hypothetical protein
MSAAPAAPAWKHDNVRVWLLAAALAWPAMGGAQTLYRCGNTYSQVPCAPDAASARVSAAAPDTVPGTSGKELCATEGVNQLRFPDPDSTRIVAITKAGSEAIPYAGKHVAARKYQLVINTRNAVGAYAGEQAYFCYLSEDERRVLKVDALRR